MNIQTYTSAIARFALPQCAGLAYLVPGLIDEIRELIEAETAEQKIKEAGDVLYFTASIRKIYGLSTNLDWGVVHCDFPASLKVFGIIAKAVRKQQDPCPVRMTAELDAIDAWASSVAHAPLETIARGNDAKLADRLDRGVIVGDGDSR